MGKEINKGKGIEGGRQGGGIKGEMGKGSNNGKGIERGRQRGV